MDKEKYEAGSWLHEKLKKEALERRIKEQELNEKIDKLRGEVLNENYRDCSII